VSTSCLFWRNAMQHVALMRHGGLRESSDMAAHDDDDLCRQQHVEQARGSA
jgi:hypothetical protein